MLEAVLRRWRRWRAYRLFGCRVEVFGRFDVIEPRGIKMGRNCAINHDVFMHGGAGITIEDNVVLSARCMLIDIGLDPESFGEASQRAYVRQPIHIREGAWIGAGAIILPGVEIGCLSIVAAGSVVTKDVPAGTVVGGNPARIIRRHDDRVEPAITDV